MPNPSRTCQAIQDQLQSVLKPLTIPYNVPALYPHKDPLNPWIVPRRFTYAFVPMLLTDQTSRLGTGNETDWITTLFVVIKFIFSWVVLMPIAVIIGGKFLSRLVELRVRSGQFFRIFIPGIFEVEARNDEVILGFAGFLITLLAIGLIGGYDAYELFRNRFGVDPGHFNSLCIFSSFATVGWSFVLNRVSCKNELKAQVYEEQKRLKEKLGSEKESEEKCQVETKEKSKGETQEEHK